MSIWGLGEPSVRSGLQTKFAHSILCVCGRYYDPTGALRELEELADKVEPSNPNSFPTLLPTPNC